MTLRKIKVTKPVVELTGDEMTRIMWDWIKEKLFMPYVEFGENNELLQTYDLSMENRDATNDQVTIDAAHAIASAGVGIKCATITATPLRMKEFNLKQLWKSPNGTIRNILDGTIFREPIICKNIPRLVPAWIMPFTIGRHALGDQYDATDMRISGPGVLKMVFIPENGETVEKVVNTFNEPGVALSMYNIDSSIYGFARSCFALALQKKCNLYFSHKDTILKKYDGRFVEIFAEVATEYEKHFDEAGITYQSKLIDDMVAFSLSEAGNYVWACKNYDGDVASDMAAKGFGSLGLMTSCLLTPDGSIMETEAAHGTVTAHFRLYQRILAENGDPTKTMSTNPIASIFAWTKGLAHRAKLDGNTDLSNFCMMLEASVIHTVEAGCYTRDLAALVHNCVNNKKLLRRDQWATTIEFLDAIDTRLQKKLQPEHVEEEN